MERNITEQNTGFEGKITLSYIDGKLAEFQANFSFRPPSSLKYEADAQIARILSPDRFFLVSDWIAYFDMDEPICVTLPSPIKAMRSLLAESCPFIPGKRIADTHFLIYLPDELGNEPLTIKKWQKMFPAGGQPCFSDYENSGNSGNINFFRLKPARFSWYLIYAGVLPGSELSNDREADALVPENYEIPSLSECQPMHFLAYLKNPLVRINEKMLGRTSDVVGHERIICGNFDCAGFVIDAIPETYRASDVGVFVCRKL